MNFKSAILTLGGLLLTLFSFSQLMKMKSQYTRADTLRGSMNANRDWWDVMRYDLNVKPDYGNKTIKGSVTINFSVVKEGQRMQIDLQQPLIVDSIISQKIVLSKTLDLITGKSDRYKFVRENNIVLLNLNRKYKKGEKESITVYYHGKPREAINPPWDGGWIWKKDAMGRPWMSVACQGLGASVWYPCKDHQSDEPDNGASLTIIVPDTLMAVGNGRLINNSKENGLASYTWEVKNPINNYLIVPSIGKYVNFTDTFMGEKGKLDLSYWVLDYNLTKAKEQFKQAKLMLRAFEYWFGPYPFYEDGYKLVESPFLGMEDQSATAYGNQFKNGYLGRDLSGSGWGLKWDYIIVHESGHEWFANNITSKDIADMWIHEGITDYSETLFTEYYYGKEAGNDYNFGQRKDIQNVRPIIGDYGVNKEGSTDMYPKGANMMHTLRHSINNDTQFRQILRGLNKTFYHKTVTTQQIEEYISKHSGFNYQKVFDQYLRNTQIPQLEYYFNNTASTVTCHWTDCVNGFDLPIVITPSSAKLHITVNWQTFKLNANEVKWWNSKNIERLFYIKTKSLLQDSQKT
jgi:aminopeptidase N